MVLSNALLELSMDYNIQITHKILEKDHTQMEVDSSLSAIVSNKKHLLTIADGSLSREARAWLPFNVNILSYEFFHGSPISDVLLDSTRASS